MSASAVLKLQKAGFTSDQVEALADFMDTQAASKADLTEAIAGVKADIAGLKAETKADLSAVEHRLELSGAANKIETIKWVVGIGFAQVAMVLTVLKLFPSAHP